MHCSFGDTDVHIPSCVSCFCTERIPPERRAFGSETSVQPEDTESRAETVTQVPSLVVSNSFDIPFYRRIC